MQGKFSKCVEWHTLFDALCLERGHLDNSRLASAYCSFTRKSTQSSYETALKNLNNWRQGVHAPSRRNFRILTLLLEVEGMDGEVQELWNRLYGDVQRRRPAVEEEGNAEEGDAGDAADPPSATTGTSGRRSGWKPAIAAAVLLLGAASFVGLTVAEDWWRPVDASKLPGAPRIDMTGQHIFNRELTVLKVGESAVIHGKRGRCAEQPVSWEETFQGLPNLSTGVWSNGGVGYRVSRSCGGPTPARAVVFTATRPGEDRFMLYEDPVVIRVEPAEAPPVADAGPAGPTAIDRAGQPVAWQPSVVAKVGEAIVVHGKRGRCGEPPPSWEEVAGELPTLSIGAWSDGGVGHRYSDACGGDTPVRAVVFTATRAGQQRLRLFGDPVDIRVEP
ncbi:MAG: hypothetical protein KIT25_01495 [Enhydrobacter sp.]|nr:MAG: hypothetical protein KIT25_01495 [Enhydrobacter sp.]